MKRWLFNIAAGVSLLIGAALLGCLVLSFDRQDGIDVVVGHTRASIQQVRGRIATKIETSPKGAPAGSFSSSFRVFGPAFSYLLATPSHTFLGFGYGLPDRDLRVTKLMLDQRITTIAQWEQRAAEKKDGNARLRAIALRQELAYPPVPWAQFEVPHWFIIVATLILPITWLREFAHKRRESREGRCRICGYDLRATPDRCPECGTPAASAG